MAKKKTQTTDETVEQEVIEVIEQPVVKTQEPVKPQWEVKDRAYRLRGKMPLAYHLRTTGLFYFDEEKGYEREIVYARNQTTPFKDEMKGDIRPQHIWFRDGFLYTKKNEVSLQKFLSLYHPGCGKVYDEIKPAEKAANQVDYIKMELAALNAASNIDINLAEAIMRAEVGSKVSKMSSSELKRDLLVFAKTNPSLFLDLMSDDNIHLRNIGIKATELGIINLSGDNRTFSWGSTGRKLMTVPFDEHPYSALAQWFKTDEGMEVLNSIEKRLN